MTGRSMPIEVLTHRSQVDATVRRGLVECWVEVTNAGGAVGFPFPPVTGDDVAPAVDQVARQLDPQRCVVFRATGESTVDGWVLLRRSDSPLVAHWGTVERLQTVPAARGRGIGRSLMMSLEEYATDEWDLVQLHLAVRGQMGLEGYYERQGWREVGRWPAALRLADDDLRDEVLMCKPLGRAT